MAGKPLDLFIQSRSGSTPGMLRTSDHSVLQQLLAYDPSARFVTENAGGEGGGGDETYISYDESKLPEFKGDLNRAREVANNKLRDPSKVVHDDVYGDWTDHTNVLKADATFLEKYAPQIGALIVAGAAPMAAGALYSSGIGLGAAGTAGVTGGAAGLAAGNIATGGQASWLTQLARKAPDIARRASNFDWSQFQKPQQQPRQMTMADILRAYGQRNYSQGGGS